jgi:hypothetical protein
MNDPRLIQLMRRTKDLVQGLAELADWIPYGAVMAEIGVWAGESTEIFCRSGRLKRLYSIDPWQDPYLHDDGQHEARFDAIAAKYGMVTKLRMTSLEAASGWAPASLDFVYIDGLHDYWSVRNDIRAWQPKIRKGGYIAGHDYWPRVPDVPRAVRDQLRAPNLVFRDSSWLIAL